MALKMVSTATPKKVTGRGYDYKPQRYIGGRPNTTTALFVVYIKPYTVSCEANKICNARIDYNADKSRDVAADYDTDTSTKFPFIGIDLLEDKYVIGDKPAVATFLDKQPALDGDVLVKTHEYIRKIFGANIIEIALSLNKDPEEDYTGLSITVKTTLKTEQSLALLDKFDEEWWLDLDVEIRNAVTVMVRSA